MKKWTALLLTLSSLLIAEDEFSLSKEFYTWNELSEQHQLDSYKDLDPGQHRTLIYLNHAPKNKAWIMKISRPLLPKEKEQMTEWSLQDLLDNGKLMNRKEPMMLITGAGFLPGEEVVVLFQGKTEKEKYASIKLIPNPIETRGVKNSASISVKIISLFPATYVIHLKNFNENEKLYFASRSLHEKIEHPMVIKKQQIMTFIPGVQGEKGGVATLSFTREGGEVFHFGLPWGSSLVGYLFGEEPPLNIEVK